MSKKPSSHSRRAFLAATAAGAAHVWIPKPVKGYSLSEVLALTPATPMGTGVSKWDLDTPALCVDLDKFEANIAVMQAALTRNKLDSRPHAKTHKCAPIAKLQMAAGAIGICTATISEAEAMVASGVDKVCMTTGNLPPNKIRRAMQLRKKSKDFIQAVDYEPNAHDTSTFSPRARKGRSGISKRTPARSRP